MQKESEVTWEELNREDELFIDDFLIKKRKEIVLVLAQKRKMSHGELAKAIGTSIASLSNILVKFEKFTYKLIDSESEGKYRYYFLTELCRKYLDNRSQIEYEQQNMKVVQQETAQLLQKIKILLENYKERCEEDYVLEFLDGLIERMYCRNIIKSEKESIIDEIIIKCEKLLLYDYETYSLEIMDMLEDKHLQSWFTRILDKFEGFRSILMDWNRQENVPQIYETLEGAVEKACRERKNNNCGNPKEESALFFTVFYIVKNMETQDKKEINDCFMRFMAGDKYLSGYITHLIMKYNQKKEE